MSRVGKQPVPVPSGVKVSIAGQKVTVEGKLGKLEREFAPSLKLSLDDTGAVIVERENDERESRALHGLTRALINNMVIGVSAGYEKRLEVVGVGYLASIQNGELQLRKQIRQIPNLR